MAWFNSFVCKQGLGTLAKLSKHHGDVDTVHPPSEASVIISGSRKWNFAARAFRIILATFVCLALIGGLVLAGIWFLVQGRSDEGNVIVTQIEASIESVLGEEFDVVMSHADLDLTDIGRIGLETSGIKINNKITDATLANISNIRVQANWLEYLAGSGGFDSVTIEGLVIDSSDYGSPDGFGLPSHIRPAFERLGELLKNSDDTFRSQGLKAVEILDSKIAGPFLGRKEESPVFISAVKLHREENGDLALEVAASTGLSNIGLSSAFVSRSNGSYIYSFDVKGISLGEWLNRPDTREGVIGANSNLAVTGLIGFDNDGKASDPDLQVVLGPGDLRLGLEATAPVEAVRLNFTALLDRNQIELDPSHLNIGRFAGSMIGGIKPDNAELGYAGPLRYDFIIKHGQFEPVDPDEPIIPGAFKAAGVVDFDARNIDIARIVFTTQRGAITGSGAIGLDGETPSMQGNLSTDGISVLALKQFWPYFIAHKARKWVQEHVQDGWIDAGSMTADIPPGILFRLRQGAKMTPEQYSSQLKVRGFRFRPFGEMPPIHDSTGTIRLHGMAITAQLDSGAAADETGKTVAIKSGSFEMLDFAAKEKVGEAKVELDGDVKTIARISERHPLRVMERMKVTPEQFSGSGHADIVARFPVGRKANYEEVDWNVLLELRDAASSKPLDGRKLSKANLLVDANPTGANVTGNLLIDGVRSKVRFVQPIGKSGKVKPKRLVTATLDDKERKKLGFDLAPVISGPITLTINRVDGRETQEIDFRQAEIALPWIGWRKGKGIAANGGFEVSQKDGRYVLKDFYLKGPGFGGAGTMVFDKSGLISADLSNLKLNDDDRTRLKIERKGDTFNINANGLYFDARSVMNKLIHSGGFAQAQGGRSVNLVANFETIGGFNGRVMRNAILLYESRGGRLTKLDMSGTGVDGRNYSVQAQLNGSETLFTMETNDAGTALAFTDIYTRMQGGNLAAKLLQSDEGPFVGPVTIRRFALVNEPRLAQLASNVRAQVQNERGDIGPIIPDGGDQVINFQLADAKIERGTGYLNVRDAIIRSGTMGLTAEGKVYDEKDRLNLSGTFMPANGINLAVSAIPILGQLLSNGRDNALIGIAYRLKGPRKNPNLQINPMSVVTPGVFNKVFEFKR